MKKLKKIGLLIASIVLSSNINVLASEMVPSNVVLEGYADGLLFIPGDEPFLEGKKMIPGDKISRTMIIENRDKTPYELFFKTDRLSRNESEKYDLLEKLNLKITYKDRVLYDQPLSEEDGVFKNVSLGTYAPNEVEVLTAEVTFDPSAGNEYKNKYASVLWTFTAYRSKPNNPGDPDDPDDPDPVNPDPEKPDPVNPDPEKPDPVNPDPEKPDPEKSDPVNPDPEKSDSGKPDQGKSDTPAKPYSSILKETIESNLGKNGTDGINGSSYISSSSAKGPYVKTGDDNCLYVISAILLISGIGLVVMIKRRRNDEK